MVEEIEVIEAAVVVEVVMIVNALNVMIVNKFLAIMPIVNL